MRCFAITMMLLATSSFAADPPPKGEVTKYSFANSKIFPGTVRDYWIYVPRQYDAKKPACLYVNQDGIQFNAPAVFDQLIDKGEMPITIGVFVRPGVVKAPNKDALDRFNRSYEYDGLGPNYVNFLLEELLPDVEKKKTADGRAIHLSKNGNDRAIGGSSSGAICAFTAAWERPDAFRRVFSSIGTYVGLRGGNEYPTLIRKTEPKPLRIFLQDGSNDLNIYGGDWWMANQEIERALTFAGYEVNHIWGTGGHSGQHATQIFPDAMRWLWKDWPAPIKTGLGSPQLREILLPGAGWEVAAGETLGSDLAANAKGEVFFNCYSKEEIYRIATDGNIHEFVSCKDREANQAFGPDGRLYIAMKGDIHAFEPDGKSKVFCADVVARGLVVRHDRSIFFGRPGGAPSEPSGLSFITRSGVKKIVIKEEHHFGCFALSPDQSLLYVGNLSNRWIESYQVKSDGQLLHQQQFVHLHLPDEVDWGGAQGLCVDRSGRIYVATKLGIQICDQAGRVNAILPVPRPYFGKARSVCFGGPQFDTLFVACDDKIYKRKTKVRGANAFEPPIKPAPPKL